MLFLLAWIWVVLGIVFYVTPPHPTKLSPAAEVMAFFACLAIGGIALPVRLLARRLK